MKLSKHIALLYLASSFLLAGSSLSVFAAPPVMSVTGSVDANVTNNVRVINPDGGALDVRIQPRRSAYALLLNATARPGEGGNTSTLPIPFDSYIVGINFIIVSHNSASCFTSVSYNHGAEIPEGANTGEIAGTGFASDDSRYVNPLSITNSEYILIPNMFIKGGDELLLFAAINNLEFGSTAPNCFVKAQIYLIPADK
ncbi:MAG: hypothetical protein K2Y09_10785 [Nitrosomonas sp.]|uniref:hypothetical protein n=1 Tax=Nitrosomonas sp. TaxID=42353 RepID=UPI001D35453E|nr:hypothetical protein [Nitrosomonas sp.]MBX9895648.1 hypothetical protein [Nitrosomonas sp.]